MLLLHVWGDATGVSVLFPECLGACWLLTTVSAECEVVTSSNTNLSDTRRLPVLYTEDGTKKHGYLEIAHYLTGQSPTLKELTLIDACLEKLHLIHLYNIYVNPTNYTQFTRKQFQKYLPFPMMYNQPLKFYAYAQGQLEAVGLGPTKSSFFGMGGDPKVPPTELVPESDSDQECSEPLSALHEKLLISKNKASGSLRETRNVMRCSRLLSRYVNEILQVCRHQSEETGVGFLQNKDTPCPGEILYYAYISCLSVPFPDTTISQSLQGEFPDMVQFIKKQGSRFEKTVKEKGTRIPLGKEIPGWVNQVKYVSGILKY